MQKNKNMEILIGKGIGDFTFGLSKNEIQLIQGKPDKSYTDDYEDLFLVYNSIKTTFKIEKESNNKFGWLETSNNETTIFNFSPWLLEQAELVAKITEILNEAPESEDYGSFESIIFNESWLELQFEYGKLKDINLGVLYDENNKTIWPNA